MRIFIADDNYLVRRTIGTLLSRQAGLEVCGEASDGPQTLDRVRELRPDLVLLDISMPDTDGFQTARQIRAEFPEMKIVIVSQNDPDHLLPTAREAGADACLDKSRLGSDLVPAVKKYAGPKARGRAAH
jgi:DNA-binding NarL/FixJ family response regulator